MRYLAVLLVGFALGLLWGETTKDQEEDNEIHFVWNDDQESIPQDGEKIVIEFTDENTVYIGTIEANQ